MDGRERCGRRVGKKVDVQPDDHPDGSTEDAPTSAHRKESVRRAQRQCDRAHTRLTPTHTHYAVPIDPPLAPESMAYGVIGDPSRLARGAAYRGPGAGIGQGLTADRDGLARSPRDEFDRRDDDFAAFSSSDNVMTEPHTLPKALGAPATRALVAAGYTSVDQLAGADATELSGLHGVGPRALRILAELLAEREAAPLRNF
jgi:hypothetical protein